MLLPLSSEDYPGGWGTQGGDERSHSSEELDQLVITLSNSVLSVVNANRFLSTLLPIGFFLNFIQIIYKKKSAESAPFSFPSVHRRTAGITGGVGLLFEGAIEPYWTPGSRGSSPQKEDVGSNVDRSDRRGPVQPDGIRGVPSGVQGHHTRTDSS